MQRILNYKILATAFLAFGLSACDQDKDVEPVIDANSKATYTITRIDEGAGNNTVTEGDILEYEITTSKMLEGAVDFTAEFNEAAAASGLDDHDYIISGGVLPAYATSTTFTVEIVNDGFPEPTETLDFDLGAYDISDNWRLSPASAAQNVNLSVANVNEEGRITIALSWPDDHDDLDMYIFSVNDDDDWGGNASATGDIPEINTNLWPNDPDGTYYVGIDPYSLESGETAYTFNIGLPDGTVTVIEGTFNLEEAIASEMPMDNGAYRLLEIIIAGGNVTINHVN